MPKPVKRTRKPASRLTQKCSRVLDSFTRLSVTERRQFANAIAQSDVGPTNPKLGNRKNPNRQAAPPTSQFTKPAATDERDYFRQAPGAGQYKTDPDGSITPGRVTLSVRMRNNPIKGLTFDRMTGYLDQWRLGFFRMAGMAWDAMERRDYQLQIVRPKRLKSVARHGYDVLTVELPDENQKSLAEQQKTFLKNFYDQASATDALNPDQEGGVSLLVRQMMDAVGKYYAVHEIVWQPREDGTLTARFIFCPIWWFEGTRGKLRFLPSEFQIYGNEMLPGDWLVTVGDGIMETCSIIYLLKYLPLKSWISFLDKFGMPGIHGKTDAQKGSREWNDFVDAVSEFGEEWATVTNRSAEISLVEAAKASGDGGYDKIVELMDRKITQLWRGADLGTQSSANGTGASLQEDESEILETDDAAIIQETLNKKVSNYALEWKFGVGCPKLAYIKLRTTPRQNIADDLKVDQFLAGFKDSDGRSLLGKQATLERYGRPLPKEDEDTLDRADALPLPPTNEDGDPNQPPAAHGQTGAVVQDTALNGAQVTALAELAEQVAAGLLPLETAKAIATASFPAVKPETIEKIFSALRSFKPRPQEAPPATFTNEAQLKQDVASVLHEMILPVLKRLEAIAQIEDATMQQHMIEKLLRDFPQIRAALKADDSLAKKLAPALEHELMTAAKPDQSK